MKASFRAHGRVQGVGFRYFARQAALDLGLAGWVRNEPDGTVAGEVAGDLSLLEAYRAHLEQGPSYGRVSRLDWSASDGGESHPHPFEVRF